MNFRRSSGKIVYYEAKRDPKTLLLEARILTKEQWERIVTRKRKERRQDGRVFENRQSVSPPR